jgi:serine/threonine protein kinase
MPVVVGHDLRDHSIGAQDMMPERIREGLSLRCPSCQTETDDAAGLCFECGASLGTIVKGSVIASRYEVLKALGKGGMGMVYLAHDRELDETVALKVLRSELAQSPDLAQRFRSEIKLARRVAHKNVCKIFEYGQDGSRQYISMAYVDGVDLKRLLRDRGPFPPEEAFDIAIRVAEALEAIHDEGIVHRDLKTPNIMKDTKGVVRVMDFGIAKAQDAGSAADLTGTGNIIGSPEYMSPEQWSGKRADARSDIYALGIVVYELFTGRPPFQGDNVLALMGMHLHEPPLEGAPVGLLGEPLRPVLERALAKEPAARFASAGEMAAALRAAKVAWLPPGEYTPVPARTLPQRGVPVRSPLVQPHDVPETEALKTPVPTASPTTAPTNVPTNVPIRRTAGRGAPVGAARPEPSHERPRNEPAGPRADAGKSPVRSAESVADTSAGADHVWEDPSSRQRRVVIAIAGAVGTIAAAVVGLVMWFGGSHPRTQPRGADSTVSPLSTPESPPPTSAPRRTTEPATTVPATPEPVRAGAPVMGTLQITAVPPASVTIDGRLVTGSLRKIVLPVGTHLVRLEHDAYRPIQRAVKVHPGQVTALEIDFAEDGVRR